MTIRSIATSGVAVLALLFTIAANGYAQKKPGYLGIRFEETVTRTNQEESERIVVSDISKDSPAEKAGVQSGDEILRVNGMVASNGKFTALARTLVEGDTVRLRLKRGGNERDVTIIAAERPRSMYAATTFVGPDSVRRLMRIYLDSARVHLDSLRLPNIRIERFGGDSTFEFRIRHFPRGAFPDSFAFKGDSAWTRIWSGPPGERIRGMPGEFHFEGELGPGYIFQLGARAIGGAELTELDPELASYFSTERGVLTLRVVPETPADRAGLQPGDVIVKAKDRAVTRVSDLRQIVAANPDGVTLEIVRKGQKKTLELKTRAR